MSRITRRSFLAGATAFTGAAVVAACGPGATTASPTASAKPSATSAPVALKGAWVALTTNQMLWPVAKEAGYFDKYGVAFDLSYINGSSTAVAALLHGDISVASVAGSAVVGAQASGTDLVMVAGFLNKAIFRVLSMGDVGSIDQLKGKTIAVTKIGNADYFAWQTIASKQGWSMNDLKFASANDVPGQIALLKSGNVQAIAVSPPNNVLALEAGAHEVFDTAAYNEPEQNVGFAALRPYLAQQHDAILGVVKASVEAMARWKKDPTFVKGVIAKYLKTSDQQFIDVGYSAYTDVWPEAPYPTEDGLRRVITQVASGNAKAKDLTPQQMVDKSFVQELESSGFIKQVYGK